MSGAGRDPRMSGSFELGRGLRRREKNATEAGPERFEKPAPDARAAPPDAPESLIGRKTVEEVPLTGLSFYESLEHRELHPKSCAGAGYPCRRPCGSPASPILLRFEATRHSLWSQHAQELIFPSVNLHRISSYCGSGFLPPARPSNAPLYGTACIRYVSSFTVRDIRCDPFLAYPCPWKKAIR